MKDLFPPDSDGQYERRHRPVPYVELPKREVSWYPYHDELGKLLYEVVRFQPKSFAQRRPDGRGSWQWGLADVRRVLFRLPQIVQKRDWPVLVVEGEKDVLLLEDLGFLATTNPGGTGMGWHDSYSRSLAGRRVVILPDCDEPGRKHADLVAGSLLRSNVGEVSIVNLPGLLDKQDVSDFVFALSANHDPRKVLIQLIKSAHKWRLAI